jgi:DNA-binding NtrC family response regulator
MKWKQFEAEAIYCFISLSPSKKTNTHKVTARKIPMNQLENKSKMNKNDNGSQIAGVDTGMEMSASAEDQISEQLPVDATLAEPMETHQTDAHFSLRSLRAEAEIYAISRTLEYTGWNRRRAAQLLSISYRGILYKIRQHNLTPSAVREVARLDQPVKVE